MTSILSEVQCLSLHLNSGFVGAREANAQVVWTTHVWNSFVFLFQNEPPREASSTRWCDMEHQQQEQLALSPSKPHYPAEFLREVSLRARCVPGGQYAFHRHPHEAGDCTHVDPCQTSSTPLPEAHGVFSQRTQYDPMT